MKRLVVAGLAAAFGFSTVTGAEFTIKDGVSNWDSADSYDEGAKPGQDDIVVIPNNARVTLDAADTASWTLVGKLARIRPVKYSSTLIVNVGSGNATFPTIFTQRTGTTTKTGEGRLVKIGDGTLTLGDFDREDGGNTGSSYNYYATLVVSNGVLKLPQNNSKAIYVVGFEIAKDTTLCLGPGYAYPRTFIGEGTITTEQTQSRLLVTNDKSEEFSFAGMINGKIRVCPDKGFFNLTGVNSTFNVPDGIQIGHGSVGVMKFGSRADTQSSIGAGYYLDSKQNVQDIPISIRSVNGTFRYLGTSETTDRRLRVWMSPAILDGGLYGGLTFTGDISGYDQGWGNTGATAMMHQLVLAGSNAAPCSIAGPISLWYAMNNKKSVYTGEVTNYTFHVTKRGSGTWRFAAPRRFLAGAIAVEEGTLQFDSINETNRTSALGTASMLREPYTAVWDPTKRAAPALTLGTATTAGALEYTGTNGGSSSCDGEDFFVSDYSWTSTRPVALKGNGKFLNSTARSFRLKGVAPAAGETSAKTVTLGGTGTGENELLDISDTAEAPIKVVKEGAGTWYLGGNQSFRGGIEVKAGTLRVRKPTDLYRYYKFTIRNILGSYVGTNGATYTQRCANIKRLALFDSENKRIQVDPTWVANVSCLTDNCAAYAENLADTNNEWTVYKWGGTYERANPAFALKANEAQQLQTCFISGTTNRYSSTVYHRTATESDPSTWISFVWKLPADAPEACGYDVAARYCKYKVAEHIPENIYHDNGGAGQPTSWALAGSVDGLSWKELTAVSGDENVLAGHNLWHFNPTKLVSDTEKDLTKAHPVVGPIAPRATTKPTVFASGVRVGVANGATAEAFGTGDAVVVSGIDIKAASGMGSVKGFSLAKTGTIDFDSIPKGVTVYSKVLAGCDNIDNVADWTLTEGGQASVKATFSISADGTIRVARKGLIMILK